MSRFLRDHSHSSFSKIQDFASDFSQLFHNRRRVVGTLSETESFISLPPPRNVEFASDWSIESERLKYSLPSHSSRGIFSVAEQEQLINLYSKLYNLPHSSIEVNRAFIKYREITLNSKPLGAINSRSKHSSVVMCNWNLTPSPESLATSLERPVRIEYFVKHTILLGEENKTHLLFSASWFNPFPGKLI